MKLIQSKCQPPNLKKLLTKAEYREVLSGIFNCSDKRCECCNYLLINDHYTFEKVQITFKLKNASHKIFLTSYMLSYVTNARKTGKVKTKLRDRFRVYHQHLWQP